jgi:predicted RNA-binding Zn ribbon-like protein
VGAVVPTVCPASCPDLPFQSKNNSRTWFDTAACANALNLRAYRERRKAARFSDLCERDPG